VLDMPEEVGKKILSTSVIGSDDDIPAYVDKADFVITVGFIKNPATRIKLYNKVKEAGGKLATVIASTAHVSKYAEIGEGTVVLHQAFVNADAKVGKNVILNTATNIEHDAVIGDQSHISTGAMVNGECKVGKNCFIGSQSVLANCITVGDDIILGAGSFVRKSITEKGVYSGNPALLKIKK
jgi:sugar O-acyltransferase (sialic acid O-acetyltransferase NeuD family)